MNSSLIVSASGVRGIVGEGLNPEVVLRFACAFGKMVKGRILVGYDTRTSNKMFKYAVFSGLLSVGCEVVDLGICPTPSIQLMVRETGADGGIAITGSHNPPEWNALKFIRRDGLFLFPEEGERLFLIYKKNKIENVRWNEIGDVSQDNSAIKRHIQKILEVVDVERIRKKGFKVVIDGCNGAGSVISPFLLKELGCEVVELNCQPNGFFPHLPEPTPANLQQLCEKVKETGADIGFAHDADADRLAIVSEKGEGLSEEYTLLLAIKSVLQKRRGPVVTNISTSKAVEDIAGEFNCPVKRTKVGDIYVSRCMKDCRAVIGGEGNGGVIFPPVNYARDGIAAIALILELAARENAPLSFITKDLPSYFMVKKKIKSIFVNFDELREKIIKNLGCVKVDLLDGIKIWLDEGWVHIRASRTEPVIRVISEAKIKEDAEKICDMVVELILKK